MTYSTAEKPSKTRKPDMEELLLFIFQVVGETLLECLAWICTDACGAIFGAGQRRIELRQQDKEEQESQASQAKWSLLRSAQNPSASGEELLRPASDGNVTEQAELLRADNKQGEPPNDTARIFDGRDP